MSVRVQALAAACVLSGVLGCTPTTHRRPSVIGAESGDPRAQLSLGMLYAYGRGVPQDDAQAAAWFRKAADQGLAAAQRRLGAMYVLGQGVPQDDVEAHRWLNLAASRRLGRQASGIRQTSRRSRAANVRRADRRGASARQGMGRAKETVEFEHHWSLTDARQRFVASMYASRPRRCNQAARLTAVVAFPAPPFKLAKPRMIMHPSGRGGQGYEAGQGHGAQF